MFAERFVAEHGFDPRETPSSQAELYVLAEQAKFALSVRPKTNVRLAFNGQESTFELTRDTFEEITGDLLERTAFTTRQVLSAAKIDWKGVDRILLVGGSTRMPMIG